MSLLSARSLLAVWERGAGESSVMQALNLLATAVPDRTIDDLGRLPIGHRDALLLTLRERLFGSLVQTVVMCPQCHDNLDLAFSLDQIRVPRESQSGEEREQFVCDIEEYQVTFRLPTSEDLLMVIDEHEPDLAKQLLLNRCLLQALDRGTTTTELSPSVIDRVIEQMAQADPQGDVQLAVTCGLCGHQWHAIFDIVSFVWCEIGAWAKRLLGEVHLLASAYGWAEDDILRMSAWRRQCYLDMVQG